MVEGRYEVRERRGEVGEERGEVGEGRGDVRERRGDGLRTSIFYDFTAIYRVMVLLSDDRKIRKDT